MKKLLLALAISLALFSVDHAHAKRHTYVPLPEQPQSTMFWPGFGSFNAEAARIGKKFKRSLRTSVDARPRAWCGWFMRQRHGIADRGLNLARNWARIGTNAGGPAPGVIGVWRHHVVEVVEVLPGGKILAISGNDGRAVRTRVRSAAGAIAWRRV